MASANCIFCHIISGEADSSIVHQDDKYVAFKDISPKSDKHVLVVPKEHIPDVTSLNDGTVQIIEDMVTIGHKIILDNGGVISDARLGFHWPPFNSIKHLHLHVIFPESRLSVWGKIIFRPKSFYFATPEDTITWLKKNKSSSP